MSTCCSTAVIQSALLTHPPALAVLHKGMIGDIYNIGTQKERSVLDVISSICKHFELNSDKIEHVKDRAFNDQRCALATSCRMRTCVDVDTQAY